VSHRELFASARVARLATAGPHLVPICFAVDGDTIWSAVDAKPKRTRSLRRLENIAADPRVAVLADHYDEDWSRLWWVRLDGRGAPLDDPAEAGRAIDALAAKYPQYRTDRPDGPVLRIEVEAYRGWSAVPPG
jgi:PPOX class probable F420-dependent enzyme